MVATCREYMNEDKQEIVQEPVANAQEEQKQEVAQQVEEVQQESEKPSKKEEPDNWRAANEVLRLQKQRIEELEQRIQQQQVAQKNHQPVEEPDEFAKLDPEDYLTVGKARQLAEKLAEKKARQTAEEIVQKYMREQNVHTDEQRAREKYQDYDYVVNTFAVPLIQTDPALAHKIMTSKNPAETAYKLGKLSDSYEEQTTEQKVSPKAEKIMKNTSRPVPGAASGSPLKSQSDQFAKLDPRSSSDKQKIWEMSERFARGGQ